LPPRRPPWLPLVVPARIPRGVVVAVGAAWVVVPAGELQQPAQLAVGVIGVLVLLVTVAGRVLRWSTTHFVLTTERLIFRSGLVAKFGREIPLERINDVTFSQSLFERLIGAGDLLVESAGEHGQSSFSNIRDPADVAPAAPPSRASPTPAPPRPSSWRSTARWRPTTAAAPATPPPSPTRRPTTR